MCVSVGRGFGELLRKQTEAQIRQKADKREQTAESRPEARMVDEKIGSSQMVHAR
jgi:hypothetical protein